MLKTNRDKEKIKEALERGVEKVYPAKADLEKKLLSGERIRLYLGVDPTGFDLHIGHSVQLKKLRQFQDLGHEVILLIGDFTALIGDPSGKDKTRNILTREEVLKNAKDYKEQASKILNFEGKNPVKLKYNSQWLAKLTFEDVVKLAANFTVQQMLERDMFQKRLEENRPIHLHEFFYPLMQGYDFVAMDVDLEIGGSDQMFNMMAGRALMKDLKNKDGFVITTKILEDSKGIKIGKTAGNVIALKADPADLYGMIMTLGDDVILKAFELCTDVAMKEIGKMEKQLKAGENPRNLKAKLAYEIVKQYNGEKAAKKAALEFDKVFREKESPTDMPVKTIKKKQYPPLELLLDLKMVDSKSEAKRVIEQGGFKINDEKITDWKTSLALKDQDVLQVGKRKFIKVKI